MTFETSINTQVPNKASSISFACEKLCTRFRPPIYVVKCGSALCKQVCTCVGVRDHKHIHTDRHTFTHGEVSTVKDLGISHESERLRQFLLVFFTHRTSGVFSFWFPLTKPPAGGLNRPLINPSVGSLLHPQPSEEGSNPAMHTKRKLSTLNL